MRNLRNASQMLGSQAPTQRPNFITAPGLQLSAYANARQDITASVVMADTALFVGLNLNGFWMVEVLANILITAAANNIRWTFAGPDGLVVNSGGAGGASAGRSFLGINGAAGQEDPFFGLGTTINGGTTSAWTSLTIRFGLQVTSPGTLMFQFAQGVSGAPITSLLGGSVMRAQYLMNNLGV